MTDVAPPMGMNSQTFDQIVAGFYRAATGDMDWDDALDGVQRAFGARAAVLQTIDLQTGQMLGLNSAGPDLNNANLSYIREYHQIDPRRRHAQAMGPAGLGRWVHCHEVFDDAYVERDAFFQHYLSAFDTRYNANVAFPIDGNIVTGFILELPAARGVLSADERAWAQRLGLHMEQALRAYQRVRMLMARTLAGHALLKNFSYPMWLLDADRFVHFENAAASRETTAETRFARRGMHLALLRSRADAELSVQLQRLRDAPHGATAVIDLRPTAADPAIWLHLSRIVPDAVLGAFGTQPMVLATVFDPQQVSALDPFALANVLKLTPAQAKVAVRLADGLTAEQIAEASGCSVTTVRSHIRQLLQRLGVQRIADIVRLTRQGEALWAKPG